MNTPRTHRLLAQTARRLYLVRLGVALRRAFLCAAAVALVTLLAARLFGLLPAGPVVQALPLLAVPAVLAALFFAKKPARHEAARLVDERTGSRELFLSAVLGGGQADGYQPIVLEQAEYRAASLEAARIVPFAWRRGVRDGLLSVAAIAALALWLPQFDPLRKQAHREQLARQQEQLRQTKTATALRAEEIQQSAARENDRVEQALAALAKTFQQAKPQERDTNLQRLAEHQKEIGELWRQAANRQRNDAFEQGAQQFGKINPKQQQAWREDLQKGDASALQREMQAIQKEMQQLAQMPDSAEKRTQQEQLAQRLATLAESLRQSASSPQLQAALQRAMEQLDLAKLGQMSQEALEAAQESMALSQQELEQLARAIQSQQALEEALKSAQMARQLAEQQQLDGEACKNCQSMGDYAALYQRLIKEGGQNTNFGTEGGGRRLASDTPPAHDDSNTTFKPDKAPGQLTAGQTLLQWKTKELGPTGTRTEEYRDAVRQVKQGVSEAIVVEQVPPGYHTAIQKYFDALPEK
jgi:hypothetical protein